MCYPRYNNIRWLFLFFNTLIAGEQGAVGDQGFPGPVGEQGLQGRQGIPGDLQPFLYFFVVRVWMYLSLRCGTNYTVLHVLKYDSVFSVSLAQRYHILVTYSNHLGLNNLLDLHEEQNGFSKCARSSDTRSLKKFL